MGRWPRSAWLLVAFTIFILAYPYFMDDPVSQLSFELTGTAVTVLASLYAVSGSGGSMVLSLGMLTIFMLAGFAVVLHPAVSSSVAVCSICLGIFLYVSFNLLRFVLSQRVVTADTLCGALAVYLLVGTAFALAFTIEELLHPGSLSGQLHPGVMGQFHFYDMLYFSYCSLTTSGYGDIAPVTPGARSLAILEQIIGVFYSGVLIARLVALYSQPPVNSAD